MKSNTIRFYKLITPIFLLLFVLTLSDTQAQLSIDATGTNYTINFDGTVSGVSNGVYDGSGYTPAPAAGQLDSDAWAISGLADGVLVFGGTQSGNDFARGTSNGGVTSGGLYAFDVGSSNFCWGVQPAGSDFTPGDVILRIQNNTGGTLIELSLSYNIYVYNDQGRANSFNFSYSSDNSSYTAIAALDFTSPEAADGSPSWVSTPRSTIISGLSIADGSFFYLKWTGDDVSGGGSRDEFGLDDIVISGSSTGGSVADPTTLLASGVSTSQIDVSWTRNDNLDDVLLAWNTTNTFGTPSGTYSVGNSISGGGTVLYVGADTTVNHTGRDPDTYYYYKAWSVDGTTTYSSGVSDSAKTLAGEPSNYPTSFSGTPGGLAIFLSWADAIGSQLPDGYLVKASDTDTLGNPADGVPLSDDIDLSDGYALLNVAYGDEECAFYGLDVETQYFFKIFPYTNSGPDIDYKTDGTPPSANASTRVVIDFNDFETGDFGTWDTVNIKGNDPSNNWLVDNSVTGALGSVYYAQMNGFMDTTSVDWLISPAINLDNYTNEAMAFFTRWFFGDNDTELTLKYSSDYSGDPTTATWTDLSFTKPPVSGAWYGSGLVDLSSLSGTINIAFLYDAINGSPRRWRVDEIAITGSGVANPNNFEASAASTSQIDLIWALNGDGDDVMVAFNTTNTFGTPSGSYSVNDPIIGGGTVLYVGSGTSTSQTSLTPGTQYFYKAWSFTGSFNYSGGLEDDATTFDTEPGTHPTGFSASATGATRINVTWTDSGADNYLVKASTIGYGDITDPVDGVSETDSKFVKNIPAGIQNVQFTGLDPQTQHYFKIFPYNGTGVSSNYKIDGTVPQATATTSDLPTGLYITEVVDPADVSNGKYVELYNGGTEAIDLSEIPINLVRQANGGNFASILLEGSIEAGEFYILANNSTDFTTAYGFEADKYSTLVSGNGDDGYFLFYDGDDEDGYLMDAYGVLDEDGTGKDWEYTDGHSVRKRDVTSASSTFSMDDWVFIGANADQMTPKAHAETVTWQGTSSTDWNEKGTNWNGTNGYVPDASYDVTIPDVTNDPVVNESSACNDLNIQSGAGFTIATSGSLNVVKE